MAPQWSSVTKRSIIGEALALPGYAALILSIRSAWLGPAAIMDPPTGTMKFLSVLCTTTSTLPLLQAWEICLQSTLACSKNSKFEIEQDLYAYSWPSCLRLHTQSKFLLVTMLEASLRLVQLFALGCPGTIGYEIMLEYLQLESGHNIKQRCPGLVLYRLSHVMWQLVSLIRILPSCQLVSI